MSSETATKNNGAQALEIARPGAQSTASVSSSNVKISPIIDAELQQREDINREICRIQKQISAVYSRYHSQADIETDSLRVAAQELTHKRDLLYPPSCFGYLGSAGSNCDTCNIGKECYRADEARMGWI